ncbi:MAG TPA: peptidase C39 family protein [Anaerolineales bacterium]|nr:peptidase C39 family protein [Anaerolineales bacterium]
MKNQFLTLARLALIGVLMLNTHEASSVSAKGKESTYQTGFIRWRAAEDGFSGWELNGVKLNSGALEFDSSTAAAGSDPYAAGSYDGGNYYNGGSFFVGEAISPEITTIFNYTDAIASWNASTPVDSWVEVQFRAQYGTRWSKWYSLGIWASDYSTIRRHSVQSQGDADGTVAVDTFVSANKKETTNTFQLKFRLFSADGASTPSVRNASVAYSTTLPKTASASGGNPALWGTLLNVPECSQMVYPNGGEVWCSPTSTSMVLGYWNNDGSSCADRETTTVDGVYDWIYNGHGNWPFNTAYAATFGYEGYVARFTSLARAEEFVKAGVPVIMSLAWKKGELTGADVESTNGHLVVLVGFDATGNPVINDPASPQNATVQRTYLRSEFEPLWLQTSGGTVYLIFPQGKTVPTLP